MKIEKIKHKLLIDDIWETTVLEDNSVRVYITRQCCYTFEEYTKDREDLKTVYSKERIQQLDEIYAYDWSKE